VSVRVVEMLTDDAIPLREIGVEPAATDHLPRGDVVAVRLRPATEALGHPDHEPEPAVLYLQVNGEGDLTVQGDGREAVVRPPARAAARAELFTGDEATYRGLVDDEDRERYGRLLETWAAHANETAETADVNAGEVMG
jgi:hypothetical protein